MAHSRFHRTGTLVGESRGRDLVSGSVLGRPGLAWSTVGDVCPETSRRLGCMRTLATPLPLYPSSRLVPVFNWAPADEQERQAQICNWKRLLEIADDLQCPIVNSEPSADRTTRS